ncbi:MAG TPA: bifunctional PIG-L family deacetylase/class I SAM-dependent methyltransferase, partial [Pyrinomonadaceae bacterium]|nr:bifunctional PIG-L family deacetylase/class I SAM-dependent methyltransferase [Pyrinomonadaceae bacterium]
MIEPGAHIFFSPHADDVVLSCGGTIHSLAAERRPVEVIGVFAGIPGTRRYSAYARQLHAKWHLPVNAIEERWREDTEAMRQVGVTAFEHWNYLEAPYRTTAHGELLYATNEDLTGEVSSEDQKLRTEISRRVQGLLERSDKTAVSYFPLSLGHHVDHQILFAIGLEMRAAGKQVRFYEDYPYVEAYEVNGHKEWQPEILPIVIGPKIRAASAYTSQLSGLGGSTAVMGKRLSDFGDSVGNGHAGERYWSLPTPAAKELVDGESQAVHPFVRKSPPLRFRDFRKFLETFRWHDLDELLPAGEGQCLDVGCGAGRHRNLIQTRGYEWFGMDRSSAAGVAQSDAAALSVSEQSVAAVVMWQVMEYAEQPEALIAEASRVLEAGGAFCGSVSFLEPVHGRTYFNLSPLILERLLRKHGFMDVEIKPGL